ncbi:MAG TPA: protealysin inhibitor emfourin [Thermoanaerobaculia bacterium]|jgi:hypothetical protein|nr:protealysin inhibitor emfourin [Thermoanaerobaculia bacterium]
MKISVQRSGGLANIGAHAEVDTSTLPREKADVLHRLIRSAAFPDQPAPPHRTAGAADVYQYDITIADGNASKTYRADELSMPEKWRAVVEHVLGKS